MRKDNAICARVLFCLSNEVYFLNDFWKNFPWSPLCTFSEKTGFELPREICHNSAILALLERRFAPKSSPVFAL